MAKILVLDIETAPAIAYVWRAWEENTSPEKLIEPGRVIMVGVQWLEDDLPSKATVFTEWEYGHADMIRIVHDLISQADAVVHFNGDKFDLPILTGEFALLGLAPPPPLTSIDVLKTVKKFGLFMNRLAYVGPLFNVGEKIKHEGFDLWRSVLAGDPKARKRMEKYCAGDVTLTTKLYLRIRPYIKNHPHLGEHKAECGACGSNHVQFRGYRRTKTFKIRRIQCQGCGSWSDGTRTKVV